MSMLFQPLLLSEFMLAKRMVMSPKNRFSSMTDSDSHVHLEHVAGELNRRNPAHLHVLEGIG